jgi:error-prone DNA polymerase
VANVISYRPRSAVRDVAKALGFSPGQQDAWSKQIEKWHGMEGGAVQGMPEQVEELANQLLGFPRHLGIHSGGMVICDRPVAEVVPVEWARMDGRTVVQWDKDDCAAVGLVKFDLLGLGMLTALHLMIDIVAEHHGRRIELHELQPVDPEVYAMLARGDSVGVFQVESRAQMATLPRLKPREFYDLVVEVALIRPGPIQGGSVHPYIRRRNELEKWDYEHPLLENALRKTLGVPLFQEQLMQVAIDVAGFSPADADELRRAMGSKRSTERMERLRGRFYAGMAVNGIEGALADKIFDRMLAFANFGFPESHSISFASLVYYSAWFKLHHPSAFCAALLNAQPMGFYSPQSLVADARRHGVRVRGPDVNLGGARAVLQPDVHSAGGQAVRLGMTDIRSVGEKLAEQIEAERGANGPYRDLADLARRVRLSVPQAEALATAGALGSFGVDRRAALWAAGVVAAVRPEQLPGTAVGLDAPALPGMTDAELTVADVWATGVSPDSHPIVHLRERLDRYGAVPIERLDAVGRAAGPDAPPRVLVGGLVTHRQRPATAGGVTFLNLEDETGMLNVTCSEGLWLRYRTVALGSAALLVRGRLERSEEGVLNLVADRLARLVLAVPVKSRDFR